MEVLKLGFVYLIKLLSIPFDLFGYKISMWALYLFGIFATMVILFVMSLFD